MDCADVAASGIHAQICERLSAQICILGLANSQQAGWVTSVTFLFYRQDEGICWFSFLLKGIVLLEKVRLCRTFARLVT